jgi:hypothetical protein
MLPVTDARLDPSLWICLHTIMVLPWHDCINLLEIAQSMNFSCFKHF